MWVFFLWGPQNSLFLEWMRHTLIFLLGLHNNRVHPVIIIIIWFLFFPSSSSLYLENSRLKIQSRLKKCFLVKISLLKKYQVSLGQDADRCQEADHCVHPDFCYSKKKSSFSSVRCVCVCCWGSERYEREKECGRRTECVCVCAYGCQSFGRKKENIENITTHGVFTLITL